MLRVVRPGIRLEPMASSIRAGRFGPVAASAWWALRSYPASTVLICAVGAVAIGAALPVAWLGSPGAPKLRLAPPPPVEFGIVFSRLAWSPAAAQGAAIEALARVLFGLAVAVLGVAVLTVLAVAAARAAARRTEMVVRRAVGAPRVKLRGSGLLEGAAMAVAAAVLGVPGGTVLWHRFTGAWPGTILAGRSVLAPGMGVGLIAVILLGALLPTIWIPRAPRVRRRGAVPHGLAIPSIQLGASLMILVAAGALAQYADRAKAGSQATGQTMGEGVIYALRQSDPIGQRAARFATLLRTLESGSSGVVSLSSAGVLSGLDPVDFVTTDCGRCSQGGLRVRFRVVPAAMGAISADTFRAMGVRLLRGRGVTDADSWEAPPVAIVNESLALSHFEGGAAVGRQIQLGAGAQRRWFTVIGVVEDRRPAALGGLFQPPFAVYVSALQQPPETAELLVRGGVRGAPRRATARAAAQIEAALGPAGRLVGRTSESSRRVSDLAAMRWFSRVARFEGVVVLAIASLGMFAVMQLWVTALLPELAVRRAVGARRRDVLRYVLGGAIAVALVGAGLGLWLNEMTSGMLAAAFAGLGVPSPALVARSAALLVLAALGGALLPAWRAARTPPAPSLAQLEN
jgi:hypothetical protein